MARSSRLTRSPPQGAIAAYRLNGCFGSKAGVCKRPEADVVSAASDSLKGGRSKRWPQDVYVLALLVAHKTPYLHSPGSLVDEDAHIVSVRHGVCCDVP